MADRIGAGPAVRGTAGCPVWRPVLGFQGVLDLAVGDLVRAVETVGVGGEQDGDAPGSAGQVALRTAGRPFLCLRQGHPSGAGTVYGWPFCGPDRGLTGERGRAQGVAHHAGRLTAIQLLL
jgi:hypothetical protein